MKKNIKNFSITAGLFLLAVVFTILVRFVDRAAIGPMDSVVGFSKLNTFFTSRISNDGLLYTLSKLLGFVPFLFVLCYVAIGIYELIKNKSLRKVDFNILMAGCVYVLLGIIYLFFEKVIINYRPVLSDNQLAASFPSSHTMMAIVICGTALFINKGLFDRSFIIKSNGLYWFIQVVVFLVGYGIILFRTFSGVHWLTDIIGGIFYGAFMVMLYYSLISLKNKESN